MTQKTPPSFERTARFYDALVFLTSGRLLRHARASYLAEILQEQSLLIAGGGTGDFLCEILRHSFPGRLCYLDVSQAMTQLARRKAKDILKKREKSLGAFHELVFCTPVFCTESLQGLADSPAWRRKAGAPFSAATAFFLFDLFSTEELRTELRALNTLLLPSARLYFCDFVINQRSPLWQKTIMKVLYLFFGRLANIRTRRPPDYDAALKAAGWRLKRETFFWKGFIQSRIYQRRTT